MMTAELGTLWEFSADRVRAVSRASADQYFTLGRGGCQRNGRPGS